jgi:hypothetical protein
LQNIPFIMYHHLNHEENRFLLPHLLPRLASIGAAVHSHAAGDGSFMSARAEAAPALRLLRVLCAAFFRPEWYTRRARLPTAAGAFSTIYTAQLPYWAGNETVVLKLVDAPRHIQDRCTQVCLGPAPSC